MDLLLLGFLYWVVYKVMRSHKAAALEVFKVLSVAFAAGLVVHIAQLIVYEYLLPSDYKVAGVAGVIAGYVYLIPTLTAWVSVWRKRARKSARVS